MVMRRLSSGERNAHVKQNSVAKIHQPAPSEQSSSAGIHAPHSLEREVRRRLLAQPGLAFSSLVVRRTRGGICLEGVLEADGNCADIGGLARTVAGVDNVINNVIHCRKPRKG